MSVINLESPTAKEDYERSIENLTPKHIELLPTWEELTAFYHK